MKTWLQTFTEEIDSVDLNLPCQTIKRLDKEDTIIGQLNEYLQKLYRLRESYRQIVEEFRDKIDDIKSVCETESRLGVLEQSSLEERAQKAKDIFDHFKTRFFLYNIIDCLFDKELEFHFPFEVDLFTHTGVREGKILIGRNNNSRGDKNDLHEYYIHHELILEMEKSLKKKNH